MENEAFTKCSQSLIAFNRAPSYKIYIRLLINLSLTALNYGPTSATEPSAQLDLVSGTICRRTSDSRTCHTAVSGSGQRHFYLVNVTKAQREFPFNRALEMLLLTYLLKLNFQR